VRLGFELGGGAASTTFLNQSATVGYGLFGLTGGIQYPWRVTPFLDGRAVGGVLALALDGGAASTAATVLGGTSAVTWIYGGGLESGIELYVVNRFYLSAAVGWMRTTWHGVDYAATLAARRMEFKDIVGDSVTVKAGLGF
jgi:hypothetical protein